MTRLTKPRSAGAVKKQPGTHIARCHAASGGHSTATRHHTCRGIASVAFLVLLMLGRWTASVSAQGEWEITPSSEQALAKGLQWLARHQGPEGNWGCQDLGLVSMGAMAFLADGHAPGRGRYGKEVQRALDFVIDNAKPSGLLNIAHAQRDMYNHGLSTLVLGQAYGMSTTRDDRVTETLDHALRLIAFTQCDDGGWGYRAERRPRGHDLSLAVMQAKALRSAMDSGLNVPADVVAKAVHSVRQYYSPRNGHSDDSEMAQREGPGQFTYSKGGGGPTLAMAAAGVVCLQELGCYDDWRIGKNMEVIAAAIRRLPPPNAGQGSMPFDAYTLYYISQAIYQDGGTNWQQSYPILRDYLTTSQRNSPSDAAKYGSWVDRGSDGHGRLSGPSGDLYATAIACFVLAIPNRYLPILQEGRIESLDQHAERGHP